MKGAVIHVLGDCVQSAGVALVSRESLAAPRPGSPAQTHSRGWQHAGAGFTSRSARAELGIPAVRPFMPMSWKLRAEQLCAVRSQPGAGGTQQATDSSLAAVVLPGG